jgi:anti-sigma regulatory factor (Ser/Thr protein kinase)
MNRSAERSRSRRTFPARKESLAEIRAFIRDQAEAAGLSAQATEDLVLAVSEACANAVLHSGSRSLDVEWALGADRVQVEIHDQGIFRSRVRVPSVEGPGGFGIPLMTALTEELEIREGTRGRPGTKVRLVKRWERSETAL